MTAPTRVLIIEDDEPNQTFIRLALTDEGFEVAVANDGDEGLRLVGEFQPDIILLDMRMPNINGEKFLTVYKADTSNEAPVVAFSASRNISDLAMELGANDFLAKPFDLKDLFTCIEAQLQARQG